MGLVHLWSGSPASRVVVPARGYARQAHKSCFDRLAAEFDAVLAGLTDAVPAEGSMAAAVRPREPWEMALDTLERLASSKPQSTEADEVSVDQPIVWQVYLGEGTVHIAPRVAGDAPRKARR